MTLLPQFLPVLTFYLALWIHKVAFIIASKKASAGNGVAAYFTLVALLGKSIEFFTVEVNVGWLPGNTWR